MGPGHTALTRIPSAPRSSATDRTRFTTAPFDVLYGHRPASPPRPEVEAVTTMDPPPTALMAGTAARMPSTTALTLTSSTWSNSSIGRVMRSPPVAMPALRTMASRRPNVSTASATAASLSVASVTSPTRMATPSRARHHSKALAARSTATTDPPSARMRSTTARPIPDAAPVTTTTLPSCAPITAT